MEIIADIESFFYEYRLPSSYRTYLIPSVVLSFVPDHCRRSKVFVVFTFFSFFVLFLVFHAQ